MVYCQNVAIKRKMMMSTAPNVVKFKKMIDEDIDENADDAKWMNVSDRHRIQTKPKKRVFRPTPWNIIAPLIAFFILIMVGLSAFYGF